MISKILLLAVALGNICYLACAEPILGTSYSVQIGTKQSGTTITHFDNNDYVTYPSVNFGEPGTTKGILLEYAKGNDNGRLEIRTGGPAGDIIAEFSPAKTGGWSNYMTAYIGIDDVDGLHDVTFVAKDTWGVLNLAWFELSDFSDRAKEYSRISASQYSTQKGVRFGTSQNMGYFDNNDYVTYSQVNFGSPGSTDGIRLSYAKANDGGRVEVRLGGPTGTLLTEFQPVKTDGWGKYMEAYLGIEGVSGVHDITFVGKDVWGVMNLAWFEPSLRNELHPKVAATAYSSKVGQVRSNTQYITYFDNNDSITYSNLNFGSDGATRSLRVTYAKANNGGRVEVRAGGQTGALIGTFSPQNTGGWSTSVTADIPLDPVEGISDLTFVGKDVWGVWNLESFELL